MSPTNPQQVPFIYNLFPKLVGHIDEWMPHVERARDMGFNWLFLNPIQLTGASGSLYAIRDYFTFSPLFFSEKEPEKQRERLRRFVEECRGMGVEVMIDLVINHTAYDNPLTKDHRNWYVINDDGSIQSPGAVDDQAPGGYVTWGDLSRIDNANSPDKGNLHEYWWKVVEMFLDCGLRGFRCDAAYQIPSELWQMLIRRAKEKAPETIFFAESLGCSQEDTLRLAEDGHDFVFNSGKWWDYRQDWFIGQINQFAGRTRSIAFPESHDTDRLAAEWDGSIPRIKQHYLFTAVISTGVLMPIGFEYGFRQKPHVVKTNPHDYEGANYDITDFIRQVNEFKKATPLFQEDNRVAFVDAFNDDVLALRKTALDGNAEALLLFNRSGGQQEVDVRRVLDALGAPPLSTEDGTASAVRLRPWGASLLRIK